MTIGGAFGIAEMHICSQRFFTCLN